MTITSSLLYWLLLWICHYMWAYINWWAKVRGPVTPYYINSPSLNLIKFEYKEANIPCWQKISSKNYGNPLRTSWANPSSSFVALSPPLPPLNTTILTHCIEEELLMTVGNGNYRNQIILAAPLMHSIEKGLS